MNALPQITYSGRIREIELGKAGCELVVGGETAYNFYSFEGTMPHSPKLSLQVIDVEPEEWPPGLLEAYKDVIDDPVMWARKCVDEYGADLVSLWLAGTDPNGANLSAAHAAEVALKVAEAISVPLIVWGVSNEEKNREVLKAVAESCSGYNLVLGPVTEGNYKQVGAAAIAYKHVVAANTPIDINLAKQLNILLENLGVPSNRILIDPTTGAVGYGLEYCYSIMERIRQAALTQNDDKLQYPIINNIGEEVWKTKEARFQEEDDPRLGDSRVRGVNLEVVTALSALQAGSDILILRHPKTLQHIRKYLDAIMMKTDLGSMGVDLSLVIAPQASPSTVASIADDLREIPGSEAARSPKKAELLQTVPATQTDSSPAVSAIPDLEAAPAPQLTPLTHESTGVGRSQQAPSPTSESPTPAGPGSMELTRADVEALRELLGAFRAVKNLVTGIAHLISKGTKEP
jgi:CO dehydrogenase/acetyl-CoA synthase delta subunit